MRKLSFLVIFLSLFLFAGRVAATTYYISSSSGSNSNSGTSEAAPWKTHPYMQTGTGCTGTGSAPNYSHSEGDQFVFKQGDSWPNACFDMVIQSGGVSGNPDIYTFDPTWGTAGGTTGNTGQAVGTYQFNAGGSVINGSDGLNNFIRVNANYVTLNGMELTGAQWSSNGTYGANHFVKIGTSTNVTLSNAWIHSWTHSGASADNQDIFSGQGGSPYNVGSRLTGSVLDGTNSGGAGVSDSGSATFAIPLVDNNIIRNMTNGALLNANGVAHDNLIGPINQSFDSSDHENCVEPIDGVSSGTSYVYIYNNVWHDCYRGVGMLTEGVAPSGSNEIDYVWNNVAYVGSVSPPPVPMQFDASLSPNTGSEVHAWNNTIYGGSVECMHTVGRGNGNFAVLDIENNHCISDAGMITLGTGGNTYTNLNNVLMSTAAAASQGFTSSKTYAYAPTSGSNSTVGVGTNLTGIASGSTVMLAYDTTYGGTRKVNGRSSTGAWDVGAYEYTSSGALAPPSPPTNVKIVGVQ